MRSFCGSAALVAALFLGACQRSSDTAAPKATLLVPASDPVAVLLQGDQLIIANRGAEPIRYAVIERTHFETALALWCVGQDECGKLVPVGESGSVRVAAIEGYRSGATEAFVFWWYVRTRAVQRVLVALS